jgi:two-component system phosphate regulon sensor histidine kinase PhoR
MLGVLAAIVVVGSVAVGLSGFAVLHRAVRANFIERLRVETATVATWAASGAASDLQDFAVRAGGGLGVRVTLIDAEGAVLADSAKSREGVLGMENHLGRPEIQAARTRGLGESFRRSDTTNVEYFYSARLVGGGGPVRYVRIALPASRVSEVEAHYGWILFTAVVLAMGLLATAAYWGVRRLSRPLERMVGAVERVARGELGAAIPEEGPEEARRLAASVDRMKQSLVESLQQVEREHGLLSSVVAGMQEGLLLVGRDRRVRLANPALRQIFDLNFEPAGHLLAEAIRHPPAVRVVERALAEGVELRESVLGLPGSGRSFEIHAASLGPEQGVLALFFDITRLEALENVRQEFVANVSHELRTPLTSIKAFVETLVSGRLEDAANSLRFLEIIGKHVDRMQALIDDITDLSRIETGAVKLELQAVDATEVAREVVEHLRPSIERHGVRVKLELPAPFRVWSDPRRLEQLLTNLVGNAVKFNRPGGEVRLGGRSDGDRSVLFVEDTGIGISTENLERIFHRFYRVDEARSREAGGTGLGLAIVKHLMRLHGGRVHVESELGSGSRFTLEFPAP